MDFDMNVTLDISEVEEFVEEVLPALLLENTTNFGIAAFCLQAVLNALEEAKAAPDDDEIDN